MENIAKEPAQDVGPAMSGVRKFGKLGLDVGIFGRWSRLLWGVAILLPLVFSAVGDLKSSGSSLSFYGLAGVYVIGISAAYVAVYWAFGERIFARANP